MELVENVVDGGSNQLHCANAGLRKSSFSAAWKTSSRGNVNVGRRHKALQHCLARRSPERIRLSRACRCAFVTHSASQASRATSRKYWARISELLFNLNCVEDAPLPSATRLDEGPYAASNSSLIASDSRGRVPQASSIILDYSSDP